MPWGGEGDPASLAGALERLEPAAGDELTVVVNSASAPSPRLRPPARVELAPDKRSSYHARNVGAARSGAPWVLFIDADCEPAPDLLDSYFDPAPDERCGALAGAVLPAGGGGLLDRYSRSRGLLDQERFLAREAPYAVTANLLVRRAAFEQLGGFAEVRSGGDVDFCWRLLAAGWQLGSRPGALVRHRHRDTLPGLLRQRARYGAGAAWLARAHPGARPTPRPLRGALSATGGAVGALARRQGEEAAFRLVDALGYLAHAAGSRRSNRAQPASDARGPRA